MAFERLKGKVTVISGGANSVGRALFFSVRMNRKAEIGRSN